MCISNSKSIKFIAFWKRKYFEWRLGSIALLLVYMLFILISSIIFYWIEAYNVQINYKKWVERVENDRMRFISSQFLPDIFNNTKLLVYIHDKKTQYLTALINSRLFEYERILKHRPPLPPMQFTFSNSLFFVMSTITTIGYGYIYPISDTGRIAAIIIGCIGIPFTIIVIKELQYIIILALHFPCLILDKIWKIFRGCTVRPTEGERIHSAKFKTQKDPLTLRERMLSIPITVAGFALIGWMSLGCCLFHIYRPNSTSLIAFYFIFNSITTIGVGDIELPENPWLLIVLLVYLFMGLAIVSSLINLIRKKFTKAYWLPGREYIPLRSETFHSGNMVSFDSDDYDDLKDLTFNHYTTLGVVHTEDTRQLLTARNKKRTLIEATTQTEPDLRPLYPILRLSNPNLSPAPVYLPILDTKNSPNDIEDLIRETYSS